MIISRSPLRISLGGGGTDLPSYYRERGGFVIAAAINKYVYVTCSRPFVQEIRLKYSAIENSKNIEEIRHPIVREALKILKLRTPQIEITSLADVPAGTGLGSSGSFTTALLKALFVHYRRSISTHELAELACQIEIEKLNEPVGKQDQYIATYGGITEFNIDNDGTVVTTPLDVAPETIHDLEDNLLLFYTGMSRSAGSILRDQVVKTENSDLKMIKELDITKQMGEMCKNALIRGETLVFAEIMREHWYRKRSRTSAMTNNFIDEAYLDAIKNGAAGGKLVGAGGGGFLMFFASDREKLRYAMNRRGLEELRFNFDFEGTKIILS